MNKQWMKKGIAGATLAAVLATASVAVYAQDTIGDVPPVADQNGGRGFRGPGMMGLNIVAEQLGIEPSELFTELQAGKTIADIAEGKGVETSAIVDAIVAAQQERLTTAVTEGQLTQDQADARLALAQADAEALLDRTFDFPDAPADGQRGGFRFGANLMGVVAEQLGIEETELRTELQSGKTIAAIAEEKGVATDTIVAAIVAAQKEVLDSAVTNGRITQDQADARLEQITTQVEAVLDQPMIGRGLDGRGPGGFGGPGGMGGQGNGPGFGGRGHGGPGNGFPGQPPVPPSDAPDAPDAPSTPNA